MPKSPQKEDGYTPIANKIMEELAKINLSPYESRVLFAIFRNTYGWHKKDVEMTLSNFEEQTGIDRRNINRSLIRLHEDGLITKNPARKNVYGKTVYKYGFDKRYWKWARGDRDTKVGALQTTIARGAGDDNIKRNKRNIKEREKRVKKPQTNGDNSRGVKVDRGPEHINQIIKRRKK